MDKERKRVLVTGAGGQLGQCLQKIASNYPFDFLFCDRNKLDVTDPDAIRTIFTDFDPQMVINTAAYTAVDRAEEEREEAFALNAVAVSNLAQACKIHDCALIHISTDYVFDGTAQNPIKETEAVNPQSVYGASKRAGEEAILKSGLSCYYIIRTSWLYSGFGANFYKTMLRLGREKDELQVVDDQFGSPTNANDLAGAILALAAKTPAPENDQNASEKHDEPKKSGIYHYANCGKTSWFGFASAIFANSGLDVKVSPVPSSAYPTKAKRPSYSVLESSKIKKTFGIKIPDWKESLEALMQKEDFSPKTKR